MLPVLIMVVGLAATSCGFYVPGVAPRDFDKEEDVEIKVKKLISFCCFLLSVDAKNAYENSVF